MRQSWNIIEDYENTHRMRYDIVMRLRFDALPFPWIKTLVCAEASNSRPLDLTTGRPYRALRALSDQVFWGARDTMEVAMKMFEELPLLFLQRYPKSKERPIRILPMYQSLISNPFACHDRTYPYYKWYNKLGTLWYPVILPGWTGSPYEMKANLLELFCLNVSYAEPAAPMITYMDPNVVQRLRSYSRNRMEKENEEHRYDERKAKIPMRLGALAVRYDEEGYFLAAERDFMWFMIYHNVTFCDIGGGISHYRFKGVTYPRPSRTTCSFVTDYSRECEAHHRMMGEDGNDAASEKFEDT